MNLHKRLITPLGKKTGLWPFGLSPEGSTLGVRLKKRHPLLLVAYLESPNYAPRDLNGTFLSATVAIN
ncbi:MAG: hypothetical protein AB2565_02065 [Candidatus Thiodiazotropha endolucinida]|uniref:Uncharacterized protein n=2 Tax=Candidatus Thiodiazotropha TaxID=1913444 RepID=A0A7Z0VLY1_9GAMM|nr:hypothetical protein [Candidatus Thiodiazotropha endolucinida]MBT3023893.1 hypothetical protein [Candidatus Thiodiazotropha taylori]MBT3053143.1 hypothetical protein [Candidatus Thiodiazotropha sp. (ex Codakia orbicularis)]MBV2119597.1 hypothetical protein [Candidatus Thiodiazotropha sp. (ex Lucina aurantia)]MBV2101260.1 hypothetical protein [Candidatus Thiodiazotropha sp. (ex Codakia orbicularis)]MCG7875484.1 hypothetical protein [Candidatus Thiodiazotropha taylori]